MKVEITPAQLKAIIMAADNLSAMTGIGNTDFDNECNRIVKLIDRFLKKNGIKRSHS